MAKVACKECGGAVSRMASKCEHCGVKSPGITNKQYVVLWGIVGVAFFLLVSAPDGEPVASSAHAEQGELADSGSAAQTKAEPTDPLIELLRSTTGDTPARAYIIDATNYAHMEFVTQSMMVSSNLLKIKRAMPELLATYPEVNHFFFGFKQNDPYYMKVNIRRAAAERVNWQTVSVYDLPGYFENYWLIPALR